MPPNPSKIMGPIQMQSSPVQRKSKEKVLSNDQIPGKTIRGTGKVKEKRNELRGNSPKMSQLTSLGQVTKQSTELPSMKPAQYAGRKSVSPDSNYAGAKFSEAPAPQILPRPPASWLSSFQRKSSIVEKPAAKSKTCSQAYATLHSQGHSDFEKITRDLKILLNVVVES